MSYAALMVHFDDEVASDESGSPSTWRIVFMPC